MELIVFKLLSYVSIGMAGWVMGMAARRKSYIVAAYFLLMVLFIWKIFNAAELGYYNN